MINESVAKLVKYGENAGLVSGLDRIYATNRLLEVMQISDYEEPEQIPEILAARDRTAAGPTAPPCGLYLDKVYYEPIEGQQS